MARVGHLPNARGFQVDSTPWDHAWQRDRHDPDALLSEGDLDRGAPPDLRRLQAMAALAAELPAWD